MFELETRWSIVVGMTLEIIVIPGTIVVAAACGSAPIPRQLGERGRRYLAARNKRGWIRCSSENSTRAWTARGVGWGVRHSPPRRRSAPPSLFTAPLSNTTPSPRGNNRLERKRRRGIERNGCLKANRRNLWGGWGTSRKSVTELGNEKSKSDLGDIRFLYSPRAVIPPSQHRTTTCVVELIPHRLFVSTIAAFACDATGGVSGSMPPPPHSPRPPPYSCALPSGKRCCTRVLGISLYKIGVHCGATIVIESIPRHDYDRRRPGTITRLGYARSRMARRTLRSCRGSNPSHRTGLSTRMCCRRVCREPAA